MRRTILWLPSPQSPLPAPLKLTAPALNSLPRRSRGTKGLSPWVPTMLTDTLSHVPAPQASPVDTLSLNLAILLASLALYCKLEYLAGWLNLRDAPPTNPG